MNSSGGWFVCENWGTNEQGKTKTGDDRKIRQIREKRNSRLALSRSPRGSRFHFFCHYSFASPFPCLFRFHVHWLFLPRRSGMTA